jgi:hypothetical protein
LERAPIRNQSKKADPKQNKTRTRKSPRLEEKRDKKNHSDVKAGILDQDTLRWFN